MKKLLFLLPILLCGCSCLLSQIPPQTIYVGENCQGVIPDYRPIVIATDNCEGLTLEQNPLPGTILGVNNPAVDVEIVGTDAFGNVSNTLTVPVILIDTIAPVLSWPIGQVAMEEKAVLDLYRNWEAAVKVHGIAKWIYDQSWTQGLPFADTLQMMESLKTFTHSITLTDMEYSEFLTYMNNN